MATIAALTYFGAFNPQKYVKDTCEFGEQLKCVDYFIGTDGTQGKIVLRFRNNFQQDINISEISGTDIEKWNITEGKIVKIGEIAKFELNTTNEIYINSPATYILNISFKRDAELAQIHQISGKLKGNVADNSLGLI